MIRPASIVTLMRWAICKTAAQYDLIEFLKSLQVLPAGSRSLVVDENGNPKPWPRSLSGD